MTIFFRKKILSSILLNTLKYYVNITKLETKVLICIEFVSALINGPRREKNCLRGFRQSETQTNLLSYQDKLEN